MNSHFQHWQLDPHINFLNHGSFGACPREVLRRQSELRSQLEREPVAFFLRELPGHLDAARESLARLLHAPPADIALVPNATTGVNAVLRSLEFQAGDELLCLDHAYNACKNVLDHVAARWGARVVVAEVPFPLQDPMEVTEAVLRAVSKQTRLAMIDHITSPTGLVLPVEHILPALHDRGIETLVDGAHVPGQLDLDIQALAPTYYTGNCHKWLCTPKGAAFLYVQPEKQEQIRPHVISHGANAPAGARSRFLMEFDWPGTGDPTAFACIPAAIEFLEGLMPGGLEGLRQHNRALVLEGRKILCAALEIPAPAPESMIAHLAAVPIPDAPPGQVVPAMGIDPLYDRMFKEERIEVPIFPWPAAPHRLLRISAQAYNEPGQYHRLAQALLRQLDQGTGA